MFEDLAGKTAVVTGGNDGIGLAVSAALGSMGCRVAIWSRDQAKNRDAIADLRGRGHDTVAFGCDVVDRTSVDRALEGTLAALGRVDCCVANAGMGGGRGVSVLDRPVEDWRRYHAVNVEGVVNCFQAVGRHFRERHRQEGPFGGRLIATSSIASQVATTRNEQYAATKAAVNALVRGFALEMGGYGVTVNAVLPGFVETKMSAGLAADEEAFEAIRSRIPLRRLARSEEFGGIFAYLASAASSYHTGNCIVIDGGFTIG